MKREEEIVRLFLLSSFRTEPIYEPLGQSTPPDFSIGKIAFEVRRLNQGFVSENGRVEGLEEVDFPLNRALRMELGKIPFSSEQGSFYVLVDFERPLRVGAAKIAREVARKAHMHYEGGTRNKLDFTVDKVSVRLIPATNPHAKAFVSAVESDADSGGMVGDIYSKAIENALNDKIVKTRDVAYKFDKWVLVLVDSILPETSWVDELGPLPVVLEHFTSIVVIDGKQILRLEWPPNSLHKP